MKIYIDEYFIPYNKLTILYWLVTSHVFYIEELLKLTNCAIDIEIMNRKMFGKKLYIFLCSFE